MARGSGRGSSRGDSIFAKIAVPVLVGIILAIAVGGTSPWWWKVLFPPPVTPTSAGDTPTPSVTAPSPSEPPSFLELLQGEWKLDTWPERPGPVTTGFHPLGGSLFIDGFGHAYWDLDLDDGGPKPPFTPGLRCPGVVDAANKTLASWTEHLTVDGNDIIGEERNWTSNLESQRNDSLVAYCGSAPSGSKLFVYDTDRSDYALTIATAGDTARTQLLTMRNAAGTFTWTKVG